MKKVITSISLIFLALTSFAQTKDTFVLRSPIMVFDSLGNVTIYQLTLDHAPTSQDSARLDSMVHYVAPAPKAINKKRKSTKVKK
jgi:hypothetical protein